MIETCDEGGPHLITKVEPPPATTKDVALTGIIPTHLAAHALLPHQHFSETGYLEADQRVTSRATLGSDLVGPVLTDNSGQARSPEGEEIACFAIDWPAHPVTWPQGKVNRRWTPSPAQQGNGQEVGALQFAPAACAACLVRARGTQAGSGPHTRKLRPQAQPDALQAARRRQQTVAFKEQ